MRNLFPGWLVLRVQTQMIVPHIQPVECEEGEVDQHHASNEHLPDEAEIAVHHVGKPRVPEDKCGHGQYIVHELPVHQALIQSFFPEPSADLDVAFFPLEGERPDVVVVAAVVGVLVLLTPFLSAAAARCCCCCCGRRRLVVGGRGRRRKRAGAVFHRVIERGRGGTRTVRYR